jgi:hypothetical protein
VVVSLEGGEGGYEVKYPRFKGRGMRGEIWNGVPFCLGTSKQFPKIESQLSITNLVTWLFLHPNSYQYSTRLYSPFPFQVVVAQHH